MPNTTDVAVLWAEVNFLDCGILLLEISIRLKRIGGNYIAWQKDKEKLKNLRFLTHVQNFESKLDIVRVKNFLFQKR